MMPPNKTLHMFPFSELKPIFVLVNSKTYNDIYWQVDHLKKNLLFFFGQECFYYLGTCWFHPNKLNYSLLLDISYIIKKIHYFRELKTETQSILLFSKFNILTFIVLNSVKWFLFNVIYICKWQAWIVTFVLIESKVISYFTS